MAKKKKQSKSKKREAVRVSHLPPRADELMDTIEEALDLCACDINEARYAENQDERRSALEDLASRIGELAGYEAQIDPDDMSESGA